MNSSWKVVSARIDALSLRERAFLFLSVIAVCVALVDRLWVAPARTAYQQVTQRFANQNVELQRLREELQARASEPDPARADRDELVRLRAAMATTNRDISAFAVSSRGAMTLPQVLVHFLRRHAGLTLVRTSNLAPDAAASGPVQALRPALADTPALVRHGLELTVAGSYPELLRYVQTLEQAMPDLRWGRLILAAEQQPPELSLQVFLVGPQP